MSKGVQIALGALCVAVLLGWYTQSAMDGSGTTLYYQTLEEFWNEGATDQDVRIHGYVVPGSIQRRLEEKNVSFAVQNDPPHAGGESAGTPLPVSYASLEVPDLFKDGAEVVVEGRISEGQEPRTFHATNVMAKCPSKFEAENTDPAPF